MKHCINLKDTYSTDQHDDLSPDIYTYNFQMHFPRYSTDEIAKTKIWEHLEKSEKYYTDGKFDDEDDQQQENQSVIETEYLDTSSETSSTDSNGNNDEEGSESNGLDNLFDGDGDSDSDY